MNAVSRLITFLLTALLAQQPADSLPLSGVVVDPAGKPVSGAQVVLAGRIPQTGSVPTLARTMTDDHGAFRLELDRQLPQGLGPLRFIWAFHPGRTVGMQRVDLTGNAALPPIRLTLAEPFKRTLTVLDSEGRPAAGVPVVPVHTSLFETPDDRLEQLRITTGADGVATLVYFPVTTDPLTVRVSIPVSSRTTSRCLMVRAAIGSR